MFVKRLKSVIKRKFQVDINAYYTSFKTGNYFNVKCPTPKALKSNVVYKFSCLCDTNITYIGMTTRHLTTRLEEHLNLKSDSAIGNHIKSCNICNNKKINIINFTILKQCNTAYKTKIQEALLIKKFNPRLNS